MASYPGSSYLQGQQLPGPPPGPPPGPSRQGSHTSQYSNASYNSYGAPSPYQQAATPAPAPTSAPQPFPPFQQQQTGQHLPTIHQHRPLSNSHMRHHSYSQPQQIPQGYLGPPGYLHPQHASAPQQSWMPPGGPGTPGGYPFGEPGYSQHPGMDPRRYSASSHGSYHSTHSKGRKSRYSDESGFSDDENWDSMYDSEEEERRRRRKERRKRREEEAEKSKKKSSKRDRPTLGDSVFAVFDGFKGAFSSTDAKH